MTREDTSSAIRANNEVVKNLEQARLQTEMLLDHSLEHMCFFNRQGTIIHANRTFFDAFDKSLTSIRFKNVAEVLGQDSWNLMKALMESGALDKDKHGQSMVNVPGLGPRRFFWVVRRYLERSAYDKLFLISGRDITDYEATKARVDQIYSLLPLGILTLGKDGCVEGLYSNFTETLLGSDQLTQMPFKSLILSQIEDSDDLQVERFVSLIDQLGQPSAMADSGSVTVKTNPKTHIDKEAEGHWLQIAVFPIISDGIVSKLFLTIQNATHIVVQQRENARLKKASLKDPLTNVGNRRAFDEAIDLAWRSFGHTNDCLGLFMIDVDFFKNFNDHYGHQGGDACLQAVSNALMKACRRARDQVFRFGGEEFVILSHDHDRDCFGRMAEYFRKAIENLQFEHEARLDQARIVTVSIGGVVIEPKTSRHYSSKEAIEKADKALYQCKKLGRNKSIVVRLNEP